MGSGYDNEREDEEMAVEYFVGIFLRLLVLFVIGVILSIFTPYIAHYLWAFLRYVIPNAVP